MWPHWSATPISYWAKTDKWILLLSDSNFPFLLVDKQNREFFPEKFSQGGVEMSFFKNVNPYVHRWRHIAFRKKIIWTLWDNSSQQNFLFRLSTHKKRKFEPLRSKINLSVFTLYEMGVAGQCGHTLFQNTKISTSHRGIISPKRYIYFLDPISVWYIFFLVFLAIKMPILLN